MTAKTPTNAGPPRQTGRGQKVAALVLAATLLASLLLPGMLERTQPVCWYCGASFAAWVILRRVRSSWANAGRSILGPVTCGLLFVLLVLMIFGNATTEAGLATVNSIERRMLWLDAHRLPDLKDWPMTTLAVLLLFTCLSYQRPGWRIVQRSKWLKDGVAQVSAAIAVASSFTFFAQTYVVAPYAQSAYLRLAASLRHSREAEVKHALSRVCAEELTQSIKALPEPARNAYRQILRTLAAWDRARATEMLADFIEFHEQPEARRDARSQPVAADAMPGLQSLPRPSELADALAAQNARELAQEKKRHAAEEEMNATLEEILGIGNEHWSDLIGELAERLLEPYIGEHSKVLSQAVSEYLSGVTGESLEQYQEGWRERQAKQLTTRVREMVEGKSDAVAELTKPEMRKLTTLIKGVSKLAYVESVDTSTPGTSSSEGSSQPETRLPSGHIHGLVRPPKNIPRQKTGREMIEELKAVRDRLALLAAHEGSTGVNGASAAGAPEGADLASVDEVIQEARRRIAEADAAIDSGRNIMLEYERESQRRSVAERPEAPRMSELPRYIP